MTMISKESGLNSFQNLVNHSYLASFISLRIPPNTCQNTSQQSYWKKLKRSTGKKKETIIMGDLNCNYLNDNDHKEIKDIFTTNGFTQLLKTPTCVTATTSTLIDIIITSNPLNISGTSNICAGLSDHNLTACTRKINSVKYQPETIICRNFSNYCVDSINRELLNADWNKLYNQQTADSAYKCLEQILLNALNRHAPLISK